MKYTIIGDPHCKPNNLLYINAIFKMAERAKYPVIVLGDTLDTKEVIRGKCLNFIYKKLKESSLQWYFLIGNHCWFNLDCEDHSLKVLNELPNVTIIDKPFRLDRMLMMPFYSNIDSFKKDLIRNIGKTDVLFMHQGVVGFDYGNGYIADGSGSGELEDVIVHKIPLVISGHFHKYAQKKNITFLGAPFSHNFGESNQEKYLGIYDSETNSLELRESLLPRHLTMEYNCSNKNEGLDSLIKSLDETDSIRIILTGTELEVKSIDKNKYPNIKFIEKISDDLQAEDDLIDEESSIESNFNTWASELRQLPPETINLGLEILGETK